MDRLAEAYRQENIASRDTRTGLLLLMLISALVDEQEHPELTREIARIASEEPEFSGRLDEFDQILAEAQNRLHSSPDDLMKRVAELLDKPAARRRGIEFAARVVTADGIVSRGQRDLLRKLAENLELSEEDFEDAILTVQRRLVRFMIVYLVYLTALSDGQVHSQEFEKMIPFALRLPAFSGVSTEEYAHICHSARDHLDEMRGERGVDYITRTLRNASDLLEQPDLPRQGLQLVARGIFADGVVRESEKEFYLKIAGKLDIDAKEAEAIISEATKENS